jgi:hypothetical protein
MPNSQYLFNGDLMSIQDVMQVGQITHYFPKIGVGVIELSQPLSVGDKILIKGPTTDFEQTVDSMQIDRENILRAEAKQAIGLKLAQPVKEKDMVYKKSQ